MGRVSLGMGLLRDHTLVLLFRHRPNSLGSVTGPKLWCIGFIKCHEPNDLQGWNKTATEAKVAVRVVPRHGQKDVEHARNRRSEIVATRLGVRSIVS